MNISGRRTNLPILSLAAVAALGLALAACGEQTGGEQQQSSAPTTEEQPSTTAQ